jgi:hypothetical protein
MNQYHEPQHPVDYSPERARRLLDEAEKIPNGHIWGRCLSHKEIQDITRYELHANALAATDSAARTVPIQRTSIDGVFAGKDDLP